MIYWESELSVKFPSPPRGFGPRTPAPQASVLSRLDYGGIRIGVFIFYLTKQLKGDVHVEDLQLMRKTNKGICGVSLPSLR